MKHSPGNGSRKSYPFLMSAPELAQDVISRFTTWGSHFSSSGLEALWRESYNLYYGNGWDEYNNIGRTGEQGEYSTIMINHARNLIKHITALTTQNRLNFDCISINSDIDSRNVAIVGNAILDQLFYDQRLSKKFVKALELGMIFGYALLVCEWARDQREIDADEGKPIYAGKPRVAVYSPLDTLQEPYKDDWSEHNWYVTRESVNKYDLAASVDDEELQEYILGLPKIQEYQQFMRYYEVDEHSVWLYKAYHKPTPALPNGRYTEFCSDQVVLFDGKNPYVFDDGETRYDGLNAFLFRPDTRYGGVYGHSPMFDLVPIQKAVNVLDSSFLTIADNFAIPNIIVSKRANLQESELSGGMRLLEIDPDPEAPNGGYPTSMEMPRISNDMAALRQNYVQDMEQISGINKVLRGDSAQAQMSGTAIALAANTSMVYNNTMEQNYTDLVEEGAYFLLKLLSKFQDYEELSVVTGQANAFQTQSFKLNNLTAIKKVRVNIGNQLAKTVAGRVSIGESLMSAGLIKDPIQYLDLLRTGTLAPILENSTMEEGYIRLENDMMGRGEQVYMAATDNHVKHMQEHRILVFRPEIRNDPVKLAAITEHIMEHQEQLLQMSISNPTVTSIILGMPVQLPQPTQDTGVGQAPGVEQQVGPEGGAPSDITEANQSAQAALEDGIAPAAEAGQERANELMAAVEGAGPSR